MFLKWKLNRYINKKQKFISKTKFSKAIKSDCLDFLEKQTKSFSSTLLSMIDEKHVSDVECYKKANIDRKLFSKIRSNVNYKPTKNTVFAFAIALKLDLSETEKLLKSAGFCISHSFITDIIIEYFIINKKYDINVINIMLYKYNQQPLTNN